jgi:hypothetical protein
MSVLFCAKAAPSRAEQPGTAADIYVSPQGNDAWSGKAAAPNAEKTDGPLATLKAAQAAARKLRAAEPNRNRPIVVMFRGGTYELDQTIVFTPADSGTKDCPTVFAAYGAEEPIISGGRAISGWKVTDKGWWQVTLPEVAAGKWRFSQLFAGDRRRYRPRLPASGYFKIAAPASPSKKARPGAGTDRFRPPAGAIDPNWHNLRDVEIIVMNSWNSARLPIADAEEGGALITLAGGGAGNSWWMSLSANRRFLADNVREALSRPGQWYLDLKSGLLTYVPAEGESPDKTAVIAPRVECLMRLSGDVAADKYVRHVEFRGLTFAHSNWNCPPQGRMCHQCELDVGSAIAAEGARNCVFKACTIKHVGQYALELGLACKENLVEDCQIVDLGGGGVKIGSTQRSIVKSDAAPGRQVDDDLAASHNTVRNCLIARGGRLHPGSIGVWIAQAHHNVVEHCDIFDFYYSGMNVGWVWGYGKSLSHHNTVCFNHIHKIGQGALNDMGGIYTLGPSEGTVLRDNVINDVSAYRYQGLGIYNDEGSSGILSENNLVYDVMDGGYHLHYGKDNIVRNNIFAFSGSGQLKITRPEAHRMFHFTRNIVYWDKGPLLAGTFSGGYQMDHNLYWQAAGQPIRMAKNDRDSIVEDPKFVNPAKRDFRLKPGSPAEKIGFKPFDYAKAGRLKGFISSTDLPAEPRAFDQASP